MLKGKNWWDLLTKPTKNPKPNKHEAHDLERGDLLNSDIPEWLQEFMENVVDDRVPERRDSHASSSHAPSLEPTPTRSVDLGKHSVYTHFPEDRNCEICQRTKITRAPCRRRIGGAVLREENFGDLIAADHKVLSEGCESRKNHRHVVVVQDVAIQWIQSYPWKTKTSQETQRSLQKFLERDRKPKVIYTDNSLEFGKACEDLSWNQCTSTPHRSETNGIGERAVRRVKEGTSAVLLQSGLVNIGGQIPWNAIPVCETFKISCLIGELQTRGVLGYHLKDRSLGSLDEYYPNSAKDQSRIHKFGKKVLPELFLGYALYAEGIWKGDMFVADIEELETTDASEIYSKRLITKEVIFPKEKGEFIFPAAHGRINLSGRDQELRTPTLTREHPIRGAGHVDFLGESEGSLPPPQDSLPDASEAINVFWSTSGNFIYRHHVEPRVKLLLAERRSMPHSTEIHWRIQNYSYEFGCQAREAHRWLLEYQCIKRFVCFL